MPFRYGRPTRRLRDTVANTFTASGTSLGSTSTSATDATIVTQNPNQPPTAIIKSPAANFVATVGVSVTLDPTGSFDPEGDWTVDWTVTGPAGVVRFTFHGPMGPMAGKITTWTPTVAEPVTVALLVTDGQGATSATSVAGTVATTSSPTTLTITPNAFALNTGGATQLLTGTVKDQNGVAMAGQSYAWAITSGPGSLSATTGQQVTYTSSATAGSVSIRCTSGTLTAAVTGTVTATSPSFVNQPAGFTAFAENTCAGTAGSNGTAISGHWTFYNQDSNNLFGSDATEPKSPPGIWTSNLYAGMTAGIGPGGGFSGWDAGGNANTYRQLYVCWWMKCRESTLECLVSPGMKTALVGYNSPISSGSNDGIWEILGSKTGTAFQIAFIQQNNVARQMNPGSNHGVAVNTGNLFTCGVWHKIESVLILNTQNVANGTFKMWIDGTQTHDYNNVMYITTTANAFFAWKGEITYGGGGTTRTTDNHIDYGHAYLSGIR